MFGFCSAPNAGSKITKPMDKTNKKQMANKGLYPAFLIFYSPPMDMVCQLHTYYTIAHFTLYRQGTMLIMIRINLYSLM